MKRWGPPVALGIVLVAAIVAGDRLLSRTPAPAPFPSTPPRPTVPPTVPPTDTDWPVTSMKAPPDPPVTPVEAPPGFDRLPTATKLHIVDEFRGLGGSRTVVLSLERRGASFAFTGSVNGGAKQSGSVPATTVVEFLGAVAKHRVESPQPTKEAEQRRYGGTTDNFPKVTITVSGIADAGSNIELSFPTQARHWRVNDLYLEIDPPDMTEATPRKLNPRINAPYAAMLKTIGVSKWEIPKKQPLAPIVRRQF